MSTWCALGTIGRFEADLGIRSTYASIIGRIWDSQSEHQTHVRVSLRSMNSTDDSISEVEQSLDRMAACMANTDTFSEAARRLSGRGPVSKGQRHGCRDPRERNQLVAVDRNLGHHDGGIRSEHRQRIDEALCRAYRDAIDQMDAISSSLLEYRPCLCLTVREFAVTPAALAEGCVRRDRVDSERMNGFVRATGRDGGTRSGHCSDWRSTHSPNSSSHSIPTGLMLAGAGQTEPRTSDVPT